MRQPSGIAIIVFLIVLSWTLGAGSADILLALGPFARSLSECGGHAAALYAPANPAAVVAPTLPSLLLAHDGSTKYSIVLPPMPSATEQFAAEELATYLGAVSGARFPIYRQGFGGRKPGIYLSADDVPGLSLPLTGEAYAVVVDRENIHLNGARGRAVLYAVYDFLERLGIAWYAPQFDFYSGAADSTPRKSSLLFGVSAKPIVRKPRLDRRKLDIGEAISHTERNLRQLIAWMPKARFNTLMVPMDYQGRGRAGWDKWRAQLTTELQKRDLILEVGGHGYQNFLNSKTADGGLFKEHSEWFGQGPDGRRSSAPDRVFCTSNQGAVRFVCDAVIKYVQARKEIQVFDFWPPDVGKWCECPRCLEQGTPAERHARLANSLHRRLAAECPGIRLECLAYSETLNPPSTPLDPPILLDFCPINQNFEYPIFDERGPNNREYAAALEAWRARFTGDIGIYSYYRKYAWKSLPVPIPRHIQKELEWYSTKQVNGISIFAEPGDWFTFELNHYVLGRVSWDPKLDLDDLLEKYCNTRFGAAAAIARSLLEALGQDLPRFGSLPFTSPKTSQEIAKARGKLSDLERRLTEAAGKLQEPYRSHCRRLQLMCGYALRDFKIQERRASAASQPEISALVLDLYEFLHSNAEAGTFMVYFGLDRPRLLKKYGVEGE